MKTEKNKEEKTEKGKIGVENRFSYITKRRRIFAMDCKETKATQAVPLKYIVEIEKPPKPFTERLREYLKSNPDMRKELIRIATRKNV